MRRLSPAPGARALPHPLPAPGLGHGAGAHPRFGTLERARAYLELTKPRVMSLLLLTTLAAMFVANGGPPPLPLVVWTLLGGAAGAVPPLVGWTAITHDLSVPANLGAWCLFAIVFFWTPPHFWALSLLIKEHYARAGVPMLPVVRGEAETRKQILLYALLLSGLTLTVTALHVMGPRYLAAAVPLNSGLVALAARLHCSPSRCAARRVYLYSLVYLALLFTAMAVDRALA